MRRSAAVLVVALGALVACPAAGAEDGPVTRHVLTNGLRLLVRPTTGAGVVAISLQVRAGSALETPETAGITQLLQRVLLRGAGDRDAAELAEAVEAIGGSLEASADADTAEVRGTGLARHWPTLLGLVADVALAPRLEPAEVEHERRLLLNQIRARADTPLSLAFDTLLADLYGPHPYALPSLGRLESVGALTRDALLAHYRAIYRPDRMVLAVSGRVDTARVVRAVERRFGGLAPAAAPGPAPPAPRGERRVLERPAHQAQIVVGVLIPGIAEPEHAAARVLGAVLGGGMAGRLFVGLRHQQGLAYSVGVLTPARAGPAFLAAYLGTARENLAAAEAGMRRELERLRAEGAAEEEVARARAYVLGSLTLDRRTNARHAWYLAHFEAVRAGWDFPDRYARAVAAVTAADVHAVARRYLGRPTVVVLEPR